MTLSDSFHLNTFIIDILTLMMRVYTFDYSYYIGLLFGCEFVYVCSVHTLVNHLPKNQISHE